MEILQENEQYRVILERHKAQNTLELHHRKTGMSQTFYFDPIGHPDNSMDELRDAYSAVRIDTLKRIMDRAGVEAVKIYKEGV